MKPIETRAEYYCARTAAQYHGAHVDPRDEHYIALECAAPLCQVLRVSAVATSGLVRAVVPTSRCEMADTPVVAVELASGLIQAERVRPSVEFVGRPGPDARYNRPNKGLDGIALDWR